MGEDYDFRELLQVLAKQYWLAPEIAESMLERILDILSQNTQM